LQEDDIPKVSTNLLQIYNHEHIQITQVQELISFRDYFIELINSEIALAFWR